jgi:hypothetical protein
MSIREKLEAAFEAVFPMPKPIRVARQANGEPWFGDGLGPYTEEYKAWDRRKTRFTRLLDAEAWLDAAMMLLPEGWTGLIPVCGGKDEEAWLWPKDGTMNKGHRCTADTPAEALLAAIEKARTT